jgi:DNA-directed RNA polymerase alpha subunit
MTQAWDFVDATVLWQSRNEFLNTPVSRINFDYDGYIGLTVRIRNACRTAGPGSEPVVTVADMVKLSEAEWLRNPNFGRKSLAAIKYVLAKHGLTLGLDL